MAPKDVSAAGVVIVSAGYKRSPLDVARDFVREQSGGEWGDQLEEKDAKLLAELLSAYGNPQNAGGPIIAPLAFGGKNCLCDAGTASWCRAIGCPHKAPATRAETNQRKDARG